MFHRGKIVAAGVRVLPFVRLFHVVVVVFRACSSTWICLLLPCLLCLLLPRLFHSLLSGPVRLLLHCPLRLLLLRPLCPFWGIKEIFLFQTFSM